ncbi:hypothetical protein [Rhizobium sp. Leaf453]|uniref:hypothetical protein n=1 Tax=Rhizobium sp. Leaf453 TaxID=1736380 RepID=UPI000714E6B1|nr:hypothetical protein [Rhizobium sp. Leaf453]KQU08037.1 hypothetical protein ASG68_23560 [Rhizobium sp. Leaf453]
MREYDGAVLFVDILGVGALTTSPKTIVEMADFAAHSRHSKPVVSNQYFCAILLSQFRRNLMAVDSDGLFVAQLSDSAFLWSKNTNLVLEAARKLFWLNAYSGVLARAGMAFGQIVEPEKVASHLGKFVCGEAVTRAVGLEQTGKGARIFVDTIIPGQILSHFGPQDFSDMTNASDFSKVDEFVWFGRPDGHQASGKMTQDQLGSVADLSFLFQSSLLYRWNAASAAGQIQLAATIDRIGTEIVKIAKRHRLKIARGAIVPRDIFLAGNPSHPERRSDERLEQMRFARDR